MHTNENTNVLSAIAAGNAHAVEITRKRARDLIDELCENDENDHLVTALDNAQGEAEKFATYVIIKINPGNI